MEMRYIWAMPNKETFLIKPIAELLAKYVKKDEKWADPFSGNNSPANLTNDLNPNTKASQHLEAFDFMGQFKDNELDGVLFDPPYSTRQISECYLGIGKAATMLDTSANFYSKVKDIIAKKVKPGGRVISFGWNSNGMGKIRGFDKEMIMLVGHGGAHNDTICVFEKHIQTVL